MPEGEGKLKFDLEERTTLFGESVIQFAKKVPVTPVTRRVIDQFVGSGASIGVNYCEAGDAELKKDFKHKIGICKKEARETKYWLRIFATVCPEYKDEIRKLWVEAKELHLILNAIYKKV